LPNAPFPISTIAEFYRFAVLLTGQIAKAEQAMAETLIKAEAALPQIRSETGRRAWFATRIREYCGVVEAPPPAAPRLLRAADDDEPVTVLEIEAYLVAQRFQQLPEPGRSALALFYLDSFTNEDIAKLLKLTEDELAATLADARLQLQRLLRGSHSAS
jgi:DNA-directed RNA polymerase specialized sigma24 family protein